MMVKGSRQSQLLRKKPQSEDITELHDANYEKQRIEGQKRVKIALKVMRKAHVEGSRADKERQRIFDTQTASDLFKRPPLPYEEEGEINIRSIEEIKNEAKTSFALTKENMKIERESKKFGKLRSICDGLTAEIRQELLRNGSSEEELLVTVADSTIIVKPLPLLRQRSRSPSAIATATAGRSNSGKFSKRQRPKSASAAVVGSSNNNNNNNSNSYCNSNSYNNSSGGGFGKQRRPLSGAPKLREARSAILPRVQTNTPHNTGTGRSSFTAWATTTTIIPTLNDKEVVVASVSSTQPKQQQQQEQPLSARSKKERELQVHLFNSKRMSTTAAAAASAAGNFKSLQLHIDIDNSNETSSMFHNSESGKPQQALKSAHARMIRSSSSSAATPLLLRPKSAGARLLLASPAAATATANSITTAAAAAYTATASAAAAAVVPSTPVSVWGVPRVMESDERYQKAQRVREEAQQQKEERVMQRILLRELAAQQRVQQEEHALRVKAWATAMALLARFSAMQSTALLYRQNVLRGEFHDSTKRAIALIKKWWVRGYVRLRFNRNPHVRPLLRRALLPFFLRLRLRRKNRASALIQEFLRDSTGLSETMRCIYAYRQSVMKVQKWMRSWFEVQMARMRCLWTIAERLSKETDAKDRNRRRKQEKGSLQEMAKVEGLADTVKEIKHVRYKLRKYLKGQEEARYVRQWEEREKDASQQSEQLREQQRQRDELQLQALRKSTQLAFEAMGVHLPPTTAATTTTTAAAAAATAAITRAGGATIASVAAAAVAKNSSSKGGNGALLLLQQQQEQQQQQQKKSRSIPWHIRIRSNGENVRIFELLRDLLQQQRRRHVMQQQHRQQRRSKDSTAASVVDVSLLKRFLRNPQQYEYIGIITHSIAVANTDQAGDDKFRGSDPFLLLTQGGIAAVESLIATNKTIRF